MATHDIEPAVDIRHWRDRPLARVMRAIVAFSAGIVLSFPASLIVVGISFMAPAGSYSQLLTVIVANALLLAPVVIAVARRGERVAAAALIAAYLLVWQFTDIGFNTFSIPIGW